MAPPPLAGVHVVSLAQNVPGPVALAQLVAAGATAVKVEPPSGDPLRTYNRAWYQALHSGVTVTEIDLKTPEGQARLHRLLASASLLLSSQRPAALGRMGLTTRGVASMHPNLRWLNIVGDTKHPERAGHDLTYQAETGLLGHEMPRTLIGDLMGAERAVATALLMLRQPAPAAAEVGLRDVLESAAVPLKRGLTAPKGVLGGGLPTYRIYAAREGMVAVAALELRFRTRLYEALDLPDGADLSGVMRSKSATQWERWASARDLPISKVKA